MRHGLLQLAVNPETPQIETQHAGPPVCPQVEPCCALKPFTHGWQSE